MLTIALGSDAEFPILPGSPVCSPCPGISLGMRMDGAAHDHSFCGRVELTRDQQAPGQPCLSLNEREGEKNPNFKVYELWN